MSRRFCNRDSAVLAALPPLAGAFVLAAACIGCDTSSPTARDDDDPTENPDPVERVETILVAAIGESRAIGPGANIQLKATAWDARSALVDGVPFTWTSADTSVATVDSLGLVTTTGLGSAQIRAAVGAKEGSASVRVLPEGVQKLTLQAAYTSLPDSGYTQTLTHVALDALDAPVTDAPLTWTTEDASIADVDAEGTVTTLGQGTVSIVARSDSATASLALRVVPVSGVGRPDVDVEMLRLLDAITPTGKLRKPTGMSVAFVRDGRLVMARGYGVVDNNSDDGVEPTSLFRIASISKPLTAVAVLQLVDAGLLSLDDRLLDIVPDLIPSEGLADARATDITVRLLLEHKSGWDRNVGPNPLWMLRTVAADRGVASPPTRQEFAHWVFRQALDFAPGTRYTYNNVNYVMLGEVIEAVTGTPYETHVREAVLAPVGVSRMRVGKTLLDDRLADEVYYQFGGTSPSIFDDVPGILPDQYGGRFNLAMTASSGAWIASAVDLARFGVAAADPTALVSSDMHGYMTTDQSGIGVYGAGWVIDADGFNHSGSLEGSNSILSVRDDGGVFVILFNGNITIPFASFAEVVLGVADWVDDDLFDRY